MAKKKTEKISGIQMLFTFEHKKTEKQIQKWMTYEESEQYVKDNPKYFKCFCVNHADSVRLGIKKPPSDFTKYVLGRVKHKVGKAGKAVERRVQIPREF